MEGFFDEVWKAGAVEDMMDRLRRQGERLTKLAYCIYPLVIGAPLAAEGDDESHGRSITHRGR